MSDQAKRESVNTATHLAGAVFATFGALLLLFASYGDWWKFASFTVYGFCLIALFTMSALYHGVRGSEKLNRRLRTLDYVSVYALITGTITPVCLVLFRGPTGMAVFIVALLVTAFGVTMRSVYHTLPEYVSMTLYLCLGWLPVLMLLLEPNIVPAGGVLWLTLGGLCYTGGAIVFALEKRAKKQLALGYHEIWHIAVLAGALCHYVFMYSYVLTAQ